MYAYKHYNPDARRPPPPSDPTAPIITTTVATQIPPTPSGPMSFSLSSLFADTRTSKRLAQRFLLPAGTRELLAPKSANVSPEELVRAGGGDVDIFGGIARDVAGMKMDKRNQEKMRRILAMLEDMAEQWEDSKGEDRGRKEKKRRGRVEETDEEGDISDNASRRDRRRIGHSRHRSDPSGDSTRSRHKSSKRDDSSSSDGDEKSAVKPERKGGKLRRVKSDLEALVNPFDSKKDDVKDASGKSKTRDGKSQSDTAGKTPTDKELRALGKDEMKALLKRLEGDRDKGKASKTRSDVRSSSSSDAAIAKSDAKPKNKSSSSVKTKSDDPLRGLSEGDLENMSREELKALIEQVERDKSPSTPAVSASSRLMTLTKEDLARMSPEELQVVMQQLDLEKRKAGRDREAEVSPPRSTKSAEPLGPDPLADYSKEDLKAMDPDKLKRLIKRREVWKAKRDAPSANLDIGPDPLAKFTKDELKQLDPDDLSKLMKLREAWKAKRDAGKVDTPKEPTLAMTLGPDPLAGLTKDELKAMDPADLKKLMKSREKWKAERDAGPSGPATIPAAKADIGPDPLGAYTKEELKALDPEKLKRLMKKREEWKAKRDAGPGAAAVPEALKGISKADLQNMSRDELKALMKQCDVSGLTDAATGRVGDNAESASAGGGEDDDDLAAFLPPKRSEAGPRPPTRRSSITRHRPHPPRQDSNTHVPQTFDWPDHEEIAQHDRTTRLRQFANEPLQRSHSPETESLVSDLDAPTPLLGEIDIAFPQTPGHDPGAVEPSSLAALAKQRPPGLDQRAALKKDTSSPPRQGYADEFLHPEKHPDVAKRPTTSYFPPVHTPPVPMPPSHLRDGPVEAPGMSNPLLHRVVTSLHACFDASKALDQHHGKLKGDSEPTAEHRFLKAMHHWLEKQHGPLQGAVELFSHADADDMLELMEAVAKLHAHLELPHLGRKTWDPQIHQAIQSKYSRVKQLFLRMAAGAVLYYMMSRIWHLSSGMLRTLEHCLDVVQNEQGSPESVLAILPKIRGQLHSATWERLAHPQAQHDVKEASDLMDILYEIAVDALPAKASSMPALYSSGPPNASLEKEGSAPSQSVRIEAPRRKDARADIAFALPSRPQILGGQPVNSPKGLISFDNPTKPQHDRRKAVKRDDPHDVLRPEALVERLQMVKRQRESADPIKPEESVAPEASAWSMGGIPAASPLTSFNLLGLSSPPRDTPDDAISNVSFSSERRPSVPEPRIPRGAARPTNPVPLAVSNGPPASDERVSHVSIHKDTVNADDTSITDYSPLQDLLESYFPGSGASLTKQLATSRRTSASGLVPLAQDVAASNLPSNPLSRQATSGIRSHHSSFTLAKPPAVRPQPVRSNAIADPSLLLLEKPLIERNREAGSDAVPIAIRPAASALQPAIGPVATFTTGAPATQTIAAKLLTTSTRSARRGRPAMRSRTALLRSSSMETSAPFTPTLASPLREVAIADDPMEDAASSLEMMSDATSLEMLRDSEEVVERTHDLVTVSSLNEGELLSSPVLSDTVVDVQAIADREAQEELESLEAEDRIPVLDSDAILADRADRLADMTDTPDSRVVTEAERELADLTSPGATVTDGSIPGPRVFTSGDVRAGEVSYQDVPTAIRGGVPRVEVTPGAIQNTDGEAIALEDEDAHLQMGETLIDGTGRMWNKNGLVEPGQDDDGDDILYEEDYAQLKRDNYGQMPVYMPWERDRIDDPGAASPGGSDSEDDRSLSVASDFTTRSPSVSPGSLDSVNDPEDIELELGEPGLDEIALMEREGIVSGAGTPMPYRDMTPYENLPRVDVDP